MNTWCIRILDLLILPFVGLAAAIMLLVRRVGVHRMPAAKKALLFVGVFPMRRHYYEPLFDTDSLRSEVAKERHLPGIEFNVEGQLVLLKSLQFEDELLTIPFEGVDPLAFHYANPRFGPGDAELLYSMIRLFKPSRIVEIGSGFSTLMARRAIAKNSQEESSYHCDHFCIEPYEEPWLERCGATIRRERVESVDKRIFQELRADDVLFIDSSHMVRPGGDVLCEYLQILPLLKSGVLVHIHDIFTPRDYPAVWLCDEVRFWNEQYLLEAFLCHNADFEIVCALNFLKHNHFSDVAKRFPLLGRENWREPGSFWIRRK